MAASTTIRVNVPPAPYKVTIHPGLLRDLAASVIAVTKSRKCCIVTDTNLQQHHLATLQASLSAAGLEAITCVLPAGEQHKTLSTIARIYDSVLPAGIDRKTPLIALGGGVIGDMTGFAAATILRGVPFIQIPTTLLAMVDASVGGKTGIDHLCGKNLIGAFHQPIAVLIDPETLLTLPDRELIGGLAECIKHDIIRDAAHFASLPAILAQARKRDIPTLAQLVAHNVAIKARVVEADPLEKGERAHLNFGHTFAHAFETVSNFAYSHGEAVALGMVAASRLARDLNLLDSASMVVISRTIAAAGLPTGQLTLEIGRAHV
jgi:3-dehydroquinate synthase